MMPHHGARRIKAQPPRDTRAQTEFGIVAICEKIFVEAADLLQHRFAVHWTAPVGPEASLFGVELSGVQRAAAAPGILPIGEHQVPGFIDARRVFPYQHLGARHPDLGTRGAGALQFRQPVRFRLGVVVEQGDEVAARGGNTLVVGRAEAAVLAIANLPRAELVFGHLRRSVAGPVVYYDGFEIDVFLAGERGQARAQQLLPVPVHHHHGDQLFMLTGAGLLRFPSAAVIPCYIMSLEVGNFSYDTRWRVFAPRTPQAQSRVGADLPRSEDLHALPPGD